MGEGFCLGGTGTIVARHEVPRPEGAIGLSPGFQPWGTTAQRFAPKGRQIERTNNAKVSPIVARLNCAL